MTEQTLYRKYRPQTFDEVLGQDDVVRTLRGAIEGKNFAHAYLFAGSRGTGKTSIARIFARAIGTSDKDLYEIDAASNRGIDDVRALREGVHVLPFESPYKVYIIDEVHMLTKEAFNALLKTLEEPPRHVIFILATTEFNKLPETIVSRCQTFRFKKPTQTLVRDLMQRVARNEGRTLDPAGAELIAVLAAGSFRDAHGILQKLLSTNGKADLEVQDVEAVTGAPQAVLIMAFVEAMAQADTAKALSIIQQHITDGTDTRTFITLVLEKIRAVLLLRYSPTFVDILKEETSTEEIAALERLAHDKQTRINSATLAVLLDASITMAQADVPSLALELAVMKLMPEDTI